MHYLCIVFSTLVVMSQEIQTSLSEMPESRQLFTDVCRIIDDTRTRVAVYVNSEVCRTNWYVGKRIKEDVLYNRRAEYGKQVIKNLSSSLTERYGSGWSVSTLQHCVRAAYTFSETDIISACRDNSVGQPCQSRPVLYSIAR